MPLPSWEGVLQAAEHVDQADDGADHPHGRGEPAHAPEEGDDHVVAVVDGLHLRVEELCDRVGVEPVDDALDSDAEELVVHPFEDVLHGEDSLAPGGVGELGELGDDPVGVGHLALETDQECLRSTQDVGHPIAGEGDAEGAHTHQHQR